MLVFFFLLTLFVLMLTWVAVRLCVWILALHSRIGGRCSYILINRLSRTLSSTDLSRSVFRPLTFHNLIFLILSMVLSVLLYILVITELLLVWELVYSFLYCLCCFFHYLLVEVPLVLKLLIERRRSIVNKLTSIFILLGLGELCKPKFVRAIETSVEYAFVLLHTLTLLVTLLLGR